MSVANRYFALESASETILLADIRPVTAER
jgi:hypothetical protein